MQGRILDQRGRGRMTNQVPDYIERRIRRPIPADSRVIPGTTPVVAFGDVGQARVATLGINPSRVEFLDPKRENFLVDSARRLATHQSLGVSDLANAPAEVIGKVLADCNGYFQRNPYRRWFDQLEQVLKACGASYYDGTACHLDLVQWATNPTWGKLSTEVQRRLLQDDAPFLLEQLTNENIELLLLNGQMVVSTMSKEGNTTLDEIGLAHQDTRLFAGMVRDRVQVVGWSTNLQSSRGVTRKLKKAIAERVGELAGK